MKKMTKGVPFFLAGFAAVIAFAIGMQMNQAGTAQSAISKPSVAPICALLIRAFLPQSRRQG